MKYYLTCGLTFCFLILPAMAHQAKSSKGKAVRKIVTARKSAAAKVAGVPKLVIEVLEHDFGKIKEGRTTSYNFLVKNEGTAELQIENVAPT